MVQTFVPKAQKDFWAFLWSSTTLIPSLATYSDAHIVVWRGEIMGKDSESSGQTGEKWHLRTEKGPDQGRSPNSLRSSSLKRQRGYLRKYYAHIGIFKGFSAYDFFHKK